MGKVCFGFFLLVVFGGLMVQPLPLILNPAQFQNMSKILFAKAAATKDEKSNSTGSSKGPQLLLNTVKKSFNLEVQDTREAAENITKTKIQRPPNGGQSLNGSPMAFFPQLDTGDDDDKEDDTVNDKTTAATSKAATQKTKRPTEWTISLPTWITDKKGNWVANPWQYTQPDAWFDTRFRVPPDKFQTNIRFDSKSPNNYKPPKTWGTIVSVCKGRSTVYNRPAVYEWLRNPTLKEGGKMILIPKRALYMDLRLEIFKDGKAESCHTKDMDTYLDYIHCAILRNMRVEYIVPRYPLHQLIRTDNMRSYLVY